MRLVGLLRQILYQIQIHGLICQKHSLCLRIVSHSDPLGSNYMLSRLCPRRWLAIPVATLPEHEEQEGPSGPSSSPQRAHAPCTESFPAVQFATSQN